jgi:hypothetical protein
MLMIARVDAAALLASGDRAVRDSAPWTDHASGL